MTKMNQTFAMTRENMKILDGHTVHDVVLGCSGDEVLELRLGRLSTRKLAGSRTLTSGLTTTVFEGEEGEQGVKLARFGLPLDGFGARRGRDQRVGMHRRGGAGLLVKVKTRDAGEGRGEEVEVGRDDVVPGRAASGDGRGAVVRARARTDVGLLRERTSRGECGKRCRGRRAGWRRANDGRRDEGWATALLAQSDWMGIGSARFRLFLPVQNDADGRLGSSLTKRRGFPDMTNLLRSFRSQSLLRAKHLSQIEPSRG